MAQILIYTLSHYHITIQKHCILKSKSNYLGFVSKSCCELKSKGNQVKNQFFLIIINQKQTSAYTRIWDSVAHGTLVLLNKDRTSNARSSVGVQKQMLWCTSPPLLKPLPHQPGFCSTLCVLYFILCNFSISKREMIF